jgi:hypothetical protein
LTRKSYVYFFIFTLYFVRGQWNTVWRTSVWRQRMQKLSDRRDFYGTHKSISRRILYG